MALDGPVVLRRPLVAAKPSCKETYIPAASREGTLPRPGPALGQFRVLRPADSCRSPVMTPWCSLILMKLWNCATIRGTGGVG